MITLIPGPGSALDGSLYYARDEYSFRFVLDPPDALNLLLVDGPLASAAIGTLQIEVDVPSGRALFVWGLHPHTRWKAGIARPDRVRVGMVHAVSSDEFVGSVSQTIAEVGEWTTVYDDASGWLRVAPSNAADDEQILIATGTVLGIRDRSLNSVWLRPVFS